MSRGELGAEEAGRGRGAGLAVGEAVAPEVVDSSGAVGVASGRKVGLRPFSFLVTGRS